MTDQKNLKIIAFVGLAGSGKSSAVEYLTEKGYPKIYFGGIVYGEMKKAGIEITPTSQQIFREELRVREGNDVLARRAIDNITDLRDAGQRHIILDGLYSWSEYKALKHAFPGELTVVAITAPKRIRHRRLANRPDRPFNDEEANTRDWTEIENLEKGGPIAIADYYIDNSHSLENLYEQIDSILHSIEF